MYFVATRIVNSTINLYSLYIIKQLRQMKTIPLCWNLADVFLMVSLGLWSTGRKITMGKCCAHQRAVYRIWMLP